jgi:hypothetical protein
MDFFLAIYISFFFQLLPFYKSNNSELVNMSANRSVENRNKTVKDINASIAQVKYIFLYYT